MNFEKPRNTPGEKVRDIEEVRQAHNRRTQEQWRQFNIRRNELRRQNLVQVIPPNHSNINFPTILRGAIDKFRQIKGDFSLLHFTIQLGRLRIEFSRATGTMGNR